MIRGWMTFLSVIIRTLSHFHSCTYTRLHICFKTHFCLMVQGRQWLGALAEDECLPATDPNHTHTCATQQRCSLIDCCLPQHWAGPMLNSFLDPQGFTKVKGQSGQTVPPVADCSAWKTDPCPRYCFPINSTWPKEKIACSIECVHLSFACSNKQLLNLEISPIRGICLVFFLLLMWDNQESKPDWEGEFTPFLSSCLAGSSAVWAMQRRFWECEEPLAAPGPTMSWLCGMWDMHSLLCGRADWIELALQAWETETKKENERDSRGRRGRLSTDYGI